MMNDPINDEILRIKRELANQFGNDLDRIVADIKSRERNTVTLEPRGFPSQTVELHNCKTSPFQKIYLLQCRVDRIVMAIYWSTCKSSRLLLGASRTPPKPFGKQLNVRFLSSAIDYIHVENSLLRMSRK